MSIKGLTDRGAEFPRIGELRKGAARTEADIAAKRPGKDLGPTFRFTSNDPAVVEEFNRAYPVEEGAPGIKELIVYLPHAQAEGNFSAWKEKWVKGGLMHRCDGQTCTLYRGEDGQIHHDPIPCPGGCKEVGRLMVILPDLKRLAYVSVLTSSKFDIIHLDAQLKAYQGLRGDLRGIPFRLYRKKELISTPEPKAESGRARREKWLLSLEPTQRWVTLQIEATRRAAVPELPAPNGRAIDAQTGEILGEDEPAPFDDETSNGNGDEEEEEQAAASKPAPAIITPPPAQAPAAAQAHVQAGHTEKSNGNGKSIPRPYTPEQVKQGIEKHMAVHDQDRGSDELCTEAQRSLVVSKLQECFATDEQAGQKASLVLRYLLNQSNLKLLTANQAARLLEWLVMPKPDSTGDYPLKPWVEREAALIVEVAAEYEPRRQAELPF